ncbi:DUF397 domain-containing protein [Streptomyces sp. NPDC003077]|uniref:DUF397 domain-containing protein n=1 Tax=Streptomyces sp. NPDC003077 TaxID=3154443 RepID=UPI0033A2737C
MYAWQKSSFSADGVNCVNIAPTPDGTLRLRESDHPETILTLSQADLRGLLGVLKADRTATPPPT